MVEDKTERGEQKIALIMDTEKHGLREGLTDRRVNSFIFLIISV